MEHPGTNIQDPTSFESNSVQETEAVATGILDFCKNRKIFAIYGELGAGKTTLVRAICGILKVEDQVKSPTFSLVNEYQGAGQTVYHFDFYRIRKVSEAWDIGFVEYLDSGCFCFVEWPEIVEELLPPDAVRIRIHSDSGNKRIFEVEI
jgi:tRNA threonylcarbamoyladenosine biosynthesis protein TsaE